MTETEQRQQVPLAVTTIAQAFKILGITGGISTDDEVRAAFKRTVRQAAEGKAGNYTQDMDVVSQAQEFLLSALKRAKEQAKVDTARQEAMRQEEEERKQRKAREQQAAKEHQKEEDQQAQQEEREQERGPEQEPLVGLAQWHEEPLQAARRLIELLQEQAQQHAHSLAHARQQDQRRMDAAMRIEE